MNVQLDCPLAPEDVKTTMTTREISVQASRNRLRDHQEKFENLSKEKMTQTCEIAGSCGRFLLDTAYEQSTILMVDLEEQLEHSESFHYSVTVIIRSLWFGSVDLQRSAQSSRSESRIILNNMELKFK